jgi:hypothetical protein
MACSFGAHLFMIVRRRDIAGLINVDNLLEQAPMSYCVVYRRFLLVERRRCLRVES